MSGMSSDILNPSSPLRDSPVVEKDPATGATQEISTTVLSKPDPKLDTATQMKNLPSVASGMPVTKMKQEGRAKMTAPKGVMKQSETLMKMVMNKEASSASKEQRLLNRPLPTIAQMDNLKTILNSVMKTSISQVLRHKIDKEEQSEGPSRSSTDMEKSKEPAEGDKSDSLTSSRKQESEVPRNDNNSMPQSKASKPEDTEPKVEKLTASLKDQGDQTHKPRKNSPLVAHKTLFTRVLPSLTKTESISPIKKQVSGTTGSPKKSRKKMFKGATYDLYLSKKKYKKKHIKRDYFQLADPSLSLRDDESSLAGTETTGSFLDSEDSVSDYQTSSEVSFQGDEALDAQKETDTSGQCVSNSQSALESPDKSRKGMLLGDGSTQNDDTSVGMVKHSESANADIPGDVEINEERNSVNDVDDDSARSRLGIHMAAVKSLAAGKSSQSESREQPDTSVTEETKNEFAPPLLDAEQPKTGDTVVGLDQSEKVPKSDTEQSGLANAEQCSSKTVELSSSPVSKSRPSDDDTNASIASGVKIRQRCKRKRLENSVDVDTLSIASSVSAASDYTDVSKSKRACKDSGLDGATKLPSRVDIVYDYKLPPIATCTCQAKALSAEEHQIFEGRIACQAIDSIDEKLVGCCNTVTTHQLVRPSVRIPFTAMCEVHLWRLGHHHCCPGCGIFCTQGNFLECIVNTNGRRQVHLFHKQCEVIKETHTTPLCPHCGKESEFQAVNLELNLPSNTMFFLTQKPSVPRARISFSWRHHAEPDVEILPSRSYKIAETGKTISSSGLPIGPERSHLETLLATLQSEKPLSLRNPIKNCYPPLKNGDVDKILQVLVSGFDPNHKFEENENEAPLHVAAKHGHLVLVHLLIQAGAYIDQVEDHLYTPLMKAIEGDQVPIICYLIRAGSKLENKAEDGTSPLHLAARNGNLGICKILLDTGRVNVNIVDDGGWTPLVWAAENKHEHVVKLLLQSGADANIRDTEENIALHWSAYSGSVNISQLFLDAGCDLSAVNEHGDTPLHIAARQDNYDCVILFLARGADIDAKNKENETPLLCCQTQNSQTALALSINHELKRLTANHIHKKEKVLHRDISKGKEQNPISCVNDIDDGLAPSDFLYITENCETSAINIDRTITSLQEGRLLPEFNLLDPPMIFECNRACLCWKTCYNRVLQNGITSCRLQLFRTAAKGWGVRTLKDIPKGTFICEYIGEIITDSEADQREDDSYLFDLDNRDGETYCLDARYYGNVSRFINHLCEPNLVPVKVFVDHQDLSFPRIAFFSSRDIAAYEELGFDYGEKFWVIKYKWFTCGCGSQKCKYSRETIQLTLENYYRRLREEQGEDETVVSGHTQ